MQIGQRFRIIERFYLRHETGEQIARPIGLRDETCQVLVPIPSFVGFGAFEQSLLGTGHLIARRHI